MEPSRFEVFKQASKIATRPPTPQEILLAVFLIALFVLIFVVLPYYVYKKYKKYLRYKKFVEVARNYNLEPEEIDFLWQLSQEFNVNPDFLLTSHAVFQKTIYRYIKKYGNENVALIQSIRQKLGFTKLPEFVPLSTTLDIDTYQPVTVIYQNEQYEAVVANNTEEFWEIAFLKGAPHDLKSGDEIIVTFLRPNDGRYIVRTRVIDIYQEGGNEIARLEHTDRLEKIQLRNFIRWPVNIPAKFTLLPFHLLQEAEDLDTLKEKLQMYDGIIRDISVGGLRLCSEYRDEFKNISEGSYLLVDFVLENTPFENVICEVRRVIKPKFTNEFCFGTTFVDLPKEYQQKIQQFIWNEQRKLIKLYKEGGL